MNPQSVEPRADEPEPKTPLFTLPERRIAIWQVIFAIAVGYAMGWLVWTVVRSPGNVLNWLFLPACTLLVIGLFVLRDQRQWAIPTRQFIELLRNVYQGTVAIEEFARVKGGPEILVPLIEDILRDLRNQQVAVAQLEKEIRDRVANRTQALERQIGSLRQQATRDVLTGLCNRRMFDSYLPQALEQCIVEKVDLSLLMIDVDNFKQLNDTLGHGAGDELLRNLGQIIRSGIRGDDAAFRLGGDEFVIVLPRINPGEAADVARRMTEVVDALTKPLRLAARPRLSIGLASLSDIGGCSPSELVQLADKRLYEVKSIRKRPAPQTKVA